MPRLLRSLSLLLASSLCLGSSECDLRFSEHHESYWITPGGNKIVDIHNYGGEGVYWHAAGLCDWLDWRIEQWVIKRKAQYQEAILRSKVAQCEFHIYDDWIVESPPLAHGSIYYDVKGYIIQLSVYSIGKASSPPPEAPSWTLRQSPTTGLWWYGYLELCADGQLRGLDVVGHELDHTIGIDHD